MFLLCVIFKYYILGYLKDSNAAAPCVDNDIFYAVFVNQQIPRLTLTLVSESSVTL